ncbi:MAG: TlpA family protein disulfide reductase [Planctomycetaceae bacterium]|nr:TlpA family protein disulfide reductase [Planctomycetaceae bacterium]
MIHRLSIVVSLLAVSLCCTIADAQDSTLYWGNGDSLKGTLKSASDKSITWHSALFTEPLEINVNVLSNIRYGDGKVEPGQNAPAASRVVLRTGDVLHADLISATDTTVTFQGARTGTTEIPRDQVLLLQRNSAAKGIIYSGPRGLEGWQPAYRRSAEDEQQRVQMLQMMRQNAVQNGQKPGDAEPKDTRWIEQPDGTLKTKRADSALFLPLTLPSKFEIEVELKSEKALSFLLAVGRNAKDGLRLESWIDILVAANGTKFTTLREIAENDKSIHLHLFVDYDSNKMMVFSRSGEKLGEIGTTGLKGSPEGLLIRNGENDLTIQQLRVNHWDGREPRILSGEGARIDLADANVLFGTIKGVNAETGMMTVEGKDATQDVALKDVVSIVFPVSDKEPPARGATQIVWTDGSNIAGTLVSIQDNVAVLTPAFSAQPVTCRLEGVARVNFTPAAKTPEQTDRLFHTAGSLQGSLVVNGEAETPIRWQPLGGLNASTLKGGDNARFVRGQAVTHFSENPAMLEGFADVVYLKNNDVLPCRVERWSEDSLQLSSPFFDVKTFPNSEIRAVELAASIRTHQSAFASEGWKGTGSRDKDKAVLSFRGQSNYFHPDIVTGDTIRFKMSWPKQSYANLSVGLFGASAKRDDQATYATFTLMQTQLQVTDRPPAQDQNQMFWGFRGNVDPESIINSPEGKVDVEMVVRDGKLLVSVDGKLMKAIRLNSSGAGARSLAFNANVMNTGAVVINGRVQQSESNSLQISKFEVDNVSGGSIRQFIAEETRQATLTIPRFRRDNPPTHVLIAPNGDVLRGKLTGITDKEVLFESRLENFRLDRSRIAAIIWLQIKKPEKEGAAGGDAKTAGAESQAGTTSDTKKPDAATEESGFVLNDEKPDTATPETAAASSATSVQAILADGYQLTLVPERLKDGMIEGASGLLKQCRFPATSIRELRLGDPNSGDVSAAFERWIAEHAREPDWDIPSDDGGNSEGAAMVGTKAPDFELPLLDGTRFRLSEHTDKIIVLDFWATWCGPCVAALPDYIAATGKFDKSKVLFIAVNQQESSDQIRNFLAQEKLDPTVALDREGSIGQSFKVSGIPHTVIIGPGNIVEDVHVGYSPTGGENMQVAIQQMLDGTWKRPQKSEGTPKENAGPEEPLKE